jgi:hypothetical protein
MTEKSKDNLLQFTTFFFQHVNPSVFEAAPPVHIPARSHHQQQQQHQVRSWSNPKPCLTNSCSSSNSWGADHIKTSFHHQQQQQHQVRSKSYPRKVSPSSAATALGEEQITSKQFSPSIAATAPDEEQITSQQGFIINSSNSTRWGTKHIPARSHHHLQQQHQVRSKSHPSKVSPSTAATAPGEEQIISRQDHHQQQQQH